MIKERYVNFEVAKLLRDKGFDEVCSAYYEDFGTHQHLYIRDRKGAYNIGFKQHDDLAYRFNLPKERYKCVAPTQAMACDWIEKKHHYIIDVHLDVESEEASSWVWSVYERINVEGREPYARLYFEDDEPYEIDNQEFAYNDALKYVLTNLI